MKLESLNSSKFKKLNSDALKAHRGGNITNTTGSGTIRIGNKDYSYINDVKDGNYIGYWIPSQVKYHWVQVQKVASPY